MIQFFIILFFIIILIIYGLIEYKRHQKQIYSIPIRIHVNGTRGKSSVTRLIGAGLRAGGVKTTTKVTGTFPRLILQNGEEATIFRKEKANILEQLNIVKYAVGIKTEALVIECMALQPTYQKITEHKMIHATISVITNVRLDHTDVMGPDLDDIANALSNTIPKNQILVTSEDRFFDFFKKKSKKYNTTIYQADGKDITDEEIRKFNYIEHKENVSLALYVCKLAGVDRETALNGMYKMIPDEGVLTKSTIIQEGKEIKFYNIFAANDPESTLYIIKTIKNHIKSDETNVILLNTRQDRIERSTQLIDFAINKTHFDILILIGQAHSTIENYALKSGISKEKIMSIIPSSPEETFKLISNLKNPKINVFGIGNMGVGGAETSKYFMNKSIK